MRDELLRTGVENSKHLQSLIVYPRVSDFGIGEKNDGVHFVAIDSDKSFFMGYTLLPAL